MGIRETIGKRPAVTGAIALLIAAGAIAYSVHSVMPSSPLNQAYFTTNDGQSVFSDSAQKLPPFSHYGRPADRAWTFTCDGGKTKFVGYLERYTPKGKAKLEAALADYNAGKIHVPPSPEPADSEVKKPGANNPWVSQADYQQASQITQVQCPHGGDLRLAVP